MDTLNNLRAMQVPAALAGRVQEMDFAPNPGGLRMMAYVPPRLAPGSALVVALHGCTQTAAGYDVGTGWSTLADRAGFAVLCPEQTRANNHNTCFNWFEPTDITRGQGEVASIAAMIGRMTAEFRIGRERVFVTGLSAGGGMAAAMLACYPELFAAGAIIAGLPFGCADSVQTALGAMYRPEPQAAPLLGGRVRAASSHCGAWPRVSIWHGSADRTVRPDNAAELVKQWTDVHGLAGTGQAQAMDGAIRRVWSGRGLRMVEQVTVPGLGHGVPIDPAESGIGSIAPFIIQAGVSSTERIAGFFGLVAERPAGARPGPAPETPASLLARVLRRAKLPGL